jgi:ribosome biogenesis GTPase / thiamine phosphate phosphatase
MHAMPDLALLGWDDAWDASFREHREEGLIPGRVAVQHRGAYDVLTEASDMRTRVAGRLRHGAARTELPVVGDWVALDAAAQTIQAVLPRRTAFARRAAHDAAGGAREQVVAANLDVVFVVSPLGESVNVPLLERYLTLAWESGARPVILLTKADLEPDPESVAAEVAAAGGVPVAAVSSRAGLGLESVRAHLAPGTTGALLGPSGAGKSRLVNALMGEEVVVTGNLTLRGEGRHTTTRRQLVLLPRGGLLIDNPGMREVQLWLADAGLEDAFPEIAELEARCRFSDCSHESEPGCAIRAALAEGTLAPERWESYRGLRRELAELEERLARRERLRARRKAPGAEAS